MGEVIRVIGWRRDAVDVTSDGSYGEPSDRHRKLALGAFYLVLEDGSEIAWPEDAVRPSSVRLVDGKWEPTADTLT